MKTIQGDTMFFAIFTQLMACQEKIEQGTCEYNGETYSVGDSFAAQDGCNQCSCDAFGEETEIICTAMACEDPETCATLSTEECETREECAVIWASPLAFDEENQCFLWANSVDAVGCMDSDLSCGEEITYSASPDNASECYGFGNNCTPQGWGECSQGNYDECE